MPIPTAKYLWLDLEMTGLDVTTDVILEVAVIVTDTHFNQLATYQEYVANDTKHVTRLMAQNNFWDAVPENRKQFLDASQDGRPVAEIDTELYELVLPFTTNDTRLILAGNSVHADRRYVERWLPQVYSLLHYRQLDVSSWKVVMESLYNVQYKKAESHRAMQDIEESIAELQHYLDYFASVGPNVR